MYRIAEKKVNLSELLSQAFDGLRGRFLEIMREDLEASLLRLRDGIIGNRRYQRGFRYKRWGYTTRKCIGTPVGVLSGLRLPRIRNAAGEVRIFLDRYVGGMPELYEVLLDQFMWGVSARRLRVVMRRLSGWSMSAGSLCRLKDRLRSLIEAERSRALPEEVPVLIIDGTYRRYRGGGKGVCLIALAVSGDGSKRLLDWQVAAQESISGWVGLFRRLQSRGLKRVQMVVSDDNAAAGSAIRSVWGPGCAHQLCLWHVGEVLKARARGKWGRFKGEYWHIFQQENGSDARETLKEFCQRWRRKEPKVVAYLKQKSQKILAHYAMPRSLHQSVRTANVAENYFRHFNTFLRRFPGFRDAEHLEFLAGAFEWSRCRNSFYQSKINEPEMPLFLQLNFNRIT